MIRPIIESDRTLFLELSKKFYSSNAVDHSIPEENFLATFDASLNHSPYCEAVMVEYEGITVGFGLYSISYSNEAGGIQILLEELFILPEYRSKGLGREFFDYVYAKFDGVARRFRLEVTKVNTRAIKLYEALGFSSLNYIQMVKDIK